tara:strand:- start:2471 stop:2809 length:339 start_codon:yes stop_codon:yes gene_type:complete
MQKLFENWRKHVNEGDVVPIRPGVKNEGVPKVECHCLCTDCVFNKNEQCVAEKIELDFEQTEDGRWICECKTYEVPEDEDRGPEEDKEDALRKKYDDEEGAYRRGSSGEDLG